MGRARATGRARVRERKQGKELGETAMGSL